LSVASVIESIPVTVTHLEMRRQPAHYPPLPLNVHVAVLKGRSMPRHFYRYLMDRVGRQWHWVNMLRLDDAALDARLSEPGREINTLYLDGAPAGFFEIAPHGADVAELHFFGLMPHATGQGLGRWFLGSAIQAAWASKPKSVIVQTCTLDHPAALPLYQKLGFEPVGQSKETITPMSMEERAKVLARG
jgi:GNAT superfamily N-acetyltransferase